MVIIIKRNCRRKCVKLVNKFCQVDADLNKIAQFPPLSPFFFCKPYFIVNNGVNDVNSDFLYTAGEL